MMMTLITIIIIMRYYNFPWVSHLAAAMERLTRGDEERTEVELHFDDANLI